MHGTPVLCDNLSSKTPICRPDRLYCNSFNVCRRLAATAAMCCRVEWQFHRWLVRKTTKWLRICKNRFYQNTAYWTKDMRDTVNSDFLEIPAKPWSYCDRMQTRALDESASSASSCTRKRTIQFRFNFDLMNREEEHTRKLQRVLLFHTHTHTYTPNAGIQMTVPVQLTPIVGSICYCPPTCIDEHSTHSDIATQFRSSPFYLAHNQIEENRMQWITKVRCARMRW